MLLTGSILLYMLVFVAGACFFLSFERDNISGAKKIGIQRRLSDIPQSWIPAQVSGKHSFGRRSSSGIPNILWKPRSISDGDSFPGASPGGGVCGLGYHGNS